ncbi:MAG: DegT/DnrJ/EryC1/StrS family aminotransferase [Candidatus Symbiothrix sp.]|jgi:hypothetical protein|nr:DegT/DnrJ/EryC1/StrS family aminotransferase [Candidatus Symbiothrix sp.]
MQLYDQFVINPDRFRGPHYNISPFSTQWVSKNYRILQSNLAVDEELIHRYFGRHVFFENGRSALYNALSTYNLSKEDEVYIVTSSGNKYISGCVTGEIEKICNWSRQLSDKTKLVLVNHEFGVAYKRMDEILNLNLPIIEDKAMSLFSTDDNQKTGAYGDFTIYSLSKFFPVQFGGVLQINTGRYSVNQFKTNSKITDILGKWTSFYLEDAGQMKQKRKDNHAQFQAELSPLGFESRFVYPETEIPSVYMCATSSNVDLDGLKVFLQQNGVEASIFYGENAFFVPVHQNLTTEDILFITSLIKYYFYESK